MADVRRGTLSAGRCERERSGVRRRGVFVAIVVALVFLAGGRRAQADPLLDLLHDKQILTDQELERVESAPLPAAQRAALVDVLTKKGVLSADEAARVQSGAQSEPAAAVATQDGAKTPSSVRETPAPLLPQTAANAVAKTTTPAQVGYDEGFFVRSADGNLALRWNGRAVTNLVADEPDTAVRDSFILDRARISADATFYKYFRGRVEGEFSSRRVLRDAYLALQPRPELNLQIGQFTVPFSYELSISKLRTDFVERAPFVTQTVGPRRDIGAMVYGAFMDETFRYQLAVMNGVGQNQTDNNSDKDVIGRLVVSPFATSNHAHLKGLNFGGAVTYGRQPAEFIQDTSGNSTPVGNSIFGASESGFTFFPAIPRRGARLRGNAHVAWLDGPVSITSEYIHASEERDGLGTGGADLSDLETDGAYVGGTWLLTGETKPYNKRVRPLRPLWAGQAPGWGALELALRYEYFELRHGADSATPALNHNRYDAALAGLNWYPNEFLRLSVNYIYSVYDRKGTNASPDPDEHSNNAVLGRAQIDF